MDACQYLQKGKHNNILITKYQWRNQRLVASRTRPPKKISREQDKATQNCESCGARHGIDKEIVICSGCCWVGYCSFTCQRNDWRKHKKVCLNKQKVCSPCDVGSGLTKSNEYKVFKSKIGNIVKMIAPACEEQRSQTLHMHC